MLAVASFVVYLIVLYFPPTARLFALVPISLLAWLIVFGAVAVSFGGMAILRRSRFDWW